MRLTYVVLQTTHCVFSFRLYVRVGFCAIGTGSGKSVRVRISGEEYVTEEFRLCNGVNGNLTLVCNYKALLVP